MVCSSPLDFFQLDQRRHAAFTLIEMSITLVIIGLVIGGMLVGRDMISAASLRADISQIEKLTTAVRTFKQKYECLPGDCTKATQFGWRPANAWYDNGNGDEKISRNNGGISANECRNFWHHLGKAGLIPDAYSGYTNGSELCSEQGASPPIASGKGWVATIGPGGGYASSTIESTLGNVFYLTSRRSSDSYYSPVYTALEAYNIDIKVDDGLPHSGLVRPGQIYHAVSVSDPASSMASGCVTSSSGYPYDVRGTTAIGWGANTLPEPDSVDCLLLWGRAY